MKRLGATLPTIRRLFALSGNRCAFPNCNHHLINEEGSLVGEICHIEGVKGERFNSSQSAESKRDFSNLILFCHEHHVETDNVAKYTVAVLKQIKTDHEKKFKSDQYTLPANLENNVLNQISTQFISLSQMAVDAKEKIDVIDKKIDSLAGSLEKNGNQEKLYLQQLESIKELRNQHKPETALEMLLDFRRRNWGNISDEVKVSLLVNIAVTYFDLQQKEAAIAAILELKKTPFENENKVSLLSLGYALLKNREEFEYFFSKAKEFNENNVNAWIGYIIMNAHQENFDEHTIPHKALNSPEVAFHLGEIFFSRGDKDRAFKYQKLAIDLQESSASKRSDTKSTVATRRLQGLADPFKLLHKHYSQQELNELDEIIRLFSESWYSIKNTELAKTRFHVIMNRGVAYNLRGNKELALEDFKTTYSISPTEAAANLIAVCIDLKKFDLAHSYITSAQADQSLSDRQRLDISVLKARCLFNEGNMALAIEELEKYLTDKNGPLHEEILQTIAGNLIEKRQIKEARSFVNRLQEEFPNRLMTHLFAGKLSFIENKNDEGHACLAKALSFLNAQTAVHEIYELASEFVNMQDYPNGILLFSKIADKNIANAVSKGLIYAQFQSGNIDQALALATNLFEHDPASPFLTEIITNCLIEVRKFDDAAQIAEKHLSVTTAAHKDFILFKCALIYHLRRDFIKSAEYVTQIEKPERFSLRKFFSLAQFQVDAQNNKAALNLAYHARTKFYDECLGHENYIRICQQIQLRHEEIFFETIQENHIVQVVDNKEKTTTYFIGKEHLPDPVAVVGKESSIAIQLLNKKLGERISIERKYGILQDFTIRLITDKYTYAFQHSTYLLETQFEDKTDFFIFQNVSEKPLESLFQVVRQMSLEGNKFHKQVHGLYNTNRIPIGVVANLFKRNLAEQWMNFTHSQEVFMYSNLFNNIKTVEEVLEQNQPIILDIFSLLIIFCVFGDETFFSHIPPLKLFVAETTIAELHAFNNEQKPFGKDGKNSMGLKNGEIAGISISAEIIQQELKTIDDIIQWCEKHATVQTPETLININREERVKRSKLLHASCFESILLAQELKGIIITSDACFQSFLFAEYKLKSISVYDMLLYRTRQKLMPETSAQEYAKKMILANCIHIPANADVLWECFERSAFQIQKPFTIATKGLMLCDPLFGADQTLLFLKKIYLNTGLASTREQIVMFILSEIARHPQFRQIKILLLIKCRLIFNLLPVAEKQFIEILNSI